MSKLIKAEAIVIKRFNYGDSDKIVTLFSSEMGKITALAKGMRKISSKKRAALEPLNKVKVSLVSTKNIPLVAEAMLLDSYPFIKQTLPKLTQAMQVLEIIDKLTAEHESHQEIYDELTNMLELINLSNWSKDDSISSIKYVLSELGFGYIEDSEGKLKDHIEEIAQKRLVSKEYLINS